ncbi:hypothetical protein BDR07DRAFT_741468 [Suillus spraguei]|nr:hypothetical protein BDR07DRAFT_741468 [Suillus spraguei]
MRTRTIDSLSNCLLFSQLAKWRRTLEKGAKRSSGNNDFNASFRSSVTKRTEEYKSPEVESLTSVLFGVRLNFIGVVTRCVIEMDYVEFRPPSRMYIAPRTLLDAKEH